MKTLFIFGILILVAFTSFSQDTIFTRNGEMIAAKVYEITQTEIKYRKPSNPDGPLYTVAKDDIAVIEYKNGSKDVFQRQQNNTSYNQAPQDQNSQQYTYYNSRPRVNVVIAPPPLIIGGGYGYRPYYRHHWRRHCGWGW